MPDAEYAGIPRWLIVGAATAVIVMAEVLGIWAFGWSAAIPTLICCGLAFVYIGALALISFTWRRPHSDKEQAE